MDDENSYLPISERKKDPCDELYDPNYVDPVHVEPKLPPAPDFKLNPSTADKIKKT